MTNVAVKLLIHALGAKDRKVRQSAAEELVQIGEPAVERLIIVLKDKDWQVRQAAAQALGQIGDIRAVDPLIDVLEDKDGDVRQAAARALRYLNTPQDRAALKEWRVAREEKLTILYIDDDPSMFDLAKHILGRVGFDLIVADGGHKGLEEVRHSKPDLVLLDLQMPDMDGREVYWQMKADEVYKSIPVIIVTARTRRFDEIFGPHIAKADGHLTKPFGPLELLESVERFLKDRKWE